MYSGHHSSCFPIPRLIMDASSSTERAALMARIDALEKRVAKIEEQTVALGDRSSPVAPRLLKVHNTRTGAVDYLFAWDKEARAAVIPHLLEYATSTNIRMALMILGSPFDVEYKAHTRPGLTIGDEITIFYYTLVKLNVPLSTLLGALKASGLISTAADIARDYPLYVEHHPGELIA